MSFCNKRITFENFLSGIPARDYIFQKAPYEELSNEAYLKMAYDRLKAISELK